MGASPTFERQHEVIEGVHVLLARLAMVLRAVIFDCMLDDLDGFLISKVKISTRVVGGEESFGTHIEAAFPGHFCWRIRGGGLDCVYIMDGGCAVRSLSTTAGDCVQGDGDAASQSESETFDLGSREGLRDESIKSDPGAVIPVGKYWDRSPVEEVRVTTHGSPQKNGQQRWTSATEASLMEVWCKGVPRHVDRG